MTIRQIYRISLLFVLVILGSLNVFAQKDSIKLRQEVEVVKNYQPSISEVEKINDIPSIKTEQTEPPVFEYSIFSKPIYANFDLTPIPAAKMIGDTKPKMEKGLLKLGAGNYLTPYGELFFNARPDKKSNFGMHFKHLSSSGKVKLLNGDNQKAPESENAAEIFGERFFRKSTLTANLAFNRTAFNYYGYSGAMLSESDKSLMPYYQHKQHFTQGSIGIRLKSGKATVGSTVNTDFGFNYHYLISKTGQKEHQTVFLADLSKKFGKTIGIMNASINYFNADNVMIRIGPPIRYGLKQQTLLQINPSMMWKSKKAQLQLGVNSTIFSDDESGNSLFVYPKVNVEWSPVLNVLTLFGNIDGHLQHNTYSSIVAENPYTDPYHNVANANFKYLFSGGLKGKISSKTNYVTEASYAMIDDQHFYVTEFNSIVVPKLLNNTFNVIYSDVNALKLSAELLHSISDKLSLHLSGNYYWYDMKSTHKAYQMPKFDFVFSTIYQPTGPLKFTADVFVVGDRTALLKDLSGAQDQLISMDPIIDLNFGSEYTLSDRWNLFVKLNNFGFQKYEQWLGYTNKGFNWLAGVSFAF